MFSTKQWVLTFARTGRQSSSRPSHMSTCRIPGALPQQPFPSTRQLQPPHVSYGWLGHAPTSSASSLRWRWSVGCRAPAVGLPPSAHKSLLCIFFLTNCSVFRTWLWGKACLYALLVPYNISIGRRWLLRAAKTRFMHPKRIKWVFGESKGTWLMRSA